MERPLVLVTDRDPTAREQIRIVFEQHGVEALGAANEADAIEALLHRPVRIVIVDANSTGVDPARVIRQARRTYPEPIVIGIGSASDPASADALFAEGAFDVVLKPFDLHRVGWAVRAALRHHELIEEANMLRGDLQRREGYGGVVGRSKVMQVLRDRIERLAATDGPVWFFGESGVGKKHAARELHAKSRRASSRFEVLACGGSEGSAWERRLGIDAAGQVQPDGLLSALTGGTLYVEDLAQQGPEEQPKWLPVLAAARAATLDVRVLASSISDPRRLVEEGRLLDGLHSLLARETLSLSPLRERTEDIPLLAQHFLRAICTINRLPPMRLEADALALLERHRWPQNVEGLRNALEQAAILAADGKVRARDLPDEVRDATPFRPATSGGASAIRRFRDAKREVVEGFERCYLSELMDRHGGNVTAASQQAGMLRSALQRLLRKYTLKSAEFRHKRPAADAGHSPRLDD